MTYRAAKRGGKEELRKRELMKMAFDWVNLNQTDGGGGKKGKESLNPY